MVYVITGEASLLDILHLAHTNVAALTVKSPEVISKDVDMTMDAEVPAGDHIKPGVSIRMGPVETDDAPTNGKRKARGSLSNGKSYKEASGSEDEKPLVRFTFSHVRTLRADSRTEQAS